MIKAGSFHLEEYHVHLYVTDDKTVKVIREANYKGKPLVGQYSYQKHSAHIPDGQNHLHVYCRQNQIFAINKDGTAHDQSHGVTIPNKVADALRKSFPNYNIPANNIIESADPFLVGLLIESTIDLYN